MSSKMPVEDAAVTESAHKKGISGGQRLWHPLQIPFFTSLFKFGWMIAALVVMASCVAAVVVSHSQQACALRINNPTSVGLPGTAERCVTFERATTQAERVHGLSDRLSMPVNHGMLFVYDQPGMLCFWMKDMHFNLDMIWLDAHRNVVTVQRNLSPSTYPHTYCPSKPAQYVLEVNAGVADAAGVAVGRRVSI